MVCEVEGGGFELLFISKPCRYCRPKWAHLHPMSTPWFSAQPVSEYFHPPNLLPTLCFDLTSKTIESDKKLLLHSICSAHWRPQFSFLTQEDQHFLDRTLIVYLSLTVCSFSWPGEGHFFLSNWPCVIGSEVAMTLRDSLV